MDDEATANSGAYPMSLDQNYSFDDSLFYENEEEQDDDNHDQVQGTPDAEEDILQLPLPVPEERTETELYSFSNRRRIHLWQASGDWQNRNNVDTNVRMV